MIHKVTTQECGEITKLSWENCGGHEVCGGPLETVSFVTAKVDTREAVAKLLQVPATELIQDGDRWYKCGCSTNGSAQTHFSGCQNYRPAGHVGNKGFELGAV